MFSRGGVTPHTYFTRWWMQYDNGTIVYNVGVKIPRPSFVNTRGVFTTFPVTTLPVQWHYQHIAEAATGQCCTPCHQAFKQLLLFCCCRSLSLTRAVALKAAIHFADRPPCSGSFDFHLEKQAHSSQESQRGISWIEPLRVTLTGPYGVMGDNTRRCRGRDCPSTFSMMCCLQDGA